MNSRERVLAAIEHREPDKVPFDLGSVGCAGMSVEVVVRLREALGLEPKPPKVTECYGMMGEIADDLHAWMGLDVIGIVSRCSMFGFPNDGWKEWVMPNEQKVLVPGLFNTQQEADGRIFQYPQGDQAAGPSAQMPAKGFYFDSLIRQEHFDEDHLDPRDNGLDFGLMSEEDCAYLGAEAERLYANTDKAIMTGVPGTAFGDVAFVPGPWLKDPRGIRDLEEWYMSLFSRQDYVRAAFELQSEIAIKNLELTRQAVGDKVQIIMVSGTDFGMQKGPMISNDVYREVFKPFNKKINDWIHEHTNWKCFQHCCGSIMPLIPEFIEAGFDILNPVQCSAANMDGACIKEQFGDQICLWGGGIDTQRILPFGSVDEIKEAVRMQVETFRQGGGFIFTPIHNVQWNTPTENVIAMIEAFGEVR